MKSSTAPVTLTEEVSDALAEGRPVVALESNVIAHGLNYPFNIETAIKVENSVRLSGAVPATTWLENGCIRIGGSQQDLERLASNSKIAKVTSRDMCVVLASKKLGVTTVAASLVAAELSGISFFSSAGIGGVHRNGERTMDISSDLIQLTRSKVAVVCAGAKNILDLGLTLEFLETHCVPLIAYRSDDFPAFFCQSSGIRAPQRLDDDAMIAQAIDCYWKLGHSGSVLLTHPICDADAIPSAEVSQVISQAISQAERSNVAGPEITKHIMNAVNEATAGRSAIANASVLISNAGIAGRLAASYAQERS